MGVRCWLVSYAAFAVGCGGPFVKRERTAPECGERSVPGCEEETFAITDPTPAGVRGSDLIRRLGGEQSAPLRFDQGVLARLGEPAGRLHVDVLRVKFEPDPYALARTCTLGWGRESVGLVVPGAITVTLPSGKRLVSPAELGRSPHGGAMLTGTHDPECAHIPAFTMVKDDAHVEIMYTFGPSPTSHWDTRCASTFADNVKRQFGVDVETLDGVFGFRGARCVVNVGSEQRSVTVERPLQFSARAERVPSCSLDQGGMKLEAKPAAGWPAQTLRATGFVFDEGQTPAFLGERETPGPALMLRGATETPMSTPDEVARQIPCTRSDASVWHWNLFFRYAAGRMQLEWGTLAWALNCRDGHVSCELEPE